MSEAKRKMLKDCDLSEINLSDDCSCDDLKAQLAERDRLDEIKDKNILFLNEQLEARDQEIEALKGNLGYAIPNGTPCTKFNNILAEFVAKQRDHLQSDLNEAIAALEKILEWHTDDSHKIAQEALAKIRQHHAENGGKTAERGGE